MTVMTVMTVMASIFIYFCVTIQLYMREKVNFGVFKCLRFFFQFRVDFVTKAGFMCCFVTNETFGDNMSYIFVSSTVASSNI